jgi:ABC-type dipeptide/oligopeptide/nickel transport system permease component
VGKYALGRLVLIVPTMLGVSVLVFALMRFVPADVVDVMIGSDVVMSPAEREILRSMCSTWVGSATWHGENSAHRCARPSRSWP